MMYYHFVYIADFKAITIYFNFLYFLLNYKVVKTHILFAKETVLTLSGTNFLLILGVNYF